MSQHLFTSESVCVGHPDTLSDQISDAIVDTLMAAHPHARAGVEAAVTAKRVRVAQFTPRKRRRVGIGVDVFEVANRCRSFCSIDRKLDCRIELLCDVPGH